MIIRKHLIIKVSQLPLSDFCVIYAASKQPTYDELSNAAMGSGYLVVYLKTV